MQISVQPSAEFRRADPIISKKKRWKSTCRRTPGIVGQMSWLERFSVIRARLVWLKILRNSQRPSILPSQWRLSSHESHRKAVYSTLALKQLQGKLRTASQQSQWKTHNSRSCCCQPPKTLKAPIATACAASAIAIIILISPLMTCFTRLKTLLTSLKLQRPANSSRILTLWINVCKRVVQPSEFNSRRILICAWRTMSSKRW